MRPLSLSLRPVHPPGGFLSQARSRSCGSAPWARFSSCASHCPWGSGQAAAAGGFPDAPALALGALPPTTSASGSCFGDDLPWAPGSVTGTWHTASPVPPADLGSARTARLPMSFKSKTKRDWVTCRRCKTESFLFFVLNRNPLFCSPRNAGGWAALGLPARRATGGERGAAGARGRRGRPSPRSPLRPARLRLARCPLTPWRARDQVPRLLKV